MAKKLNYEVMRDVTNGEALRDIIGSVDPEVLKNVDEILHKKIPDFETCSLFRRDLLRELIDLHFPVQHYVEAFFNGKDAVEELPVHTRKLAEAIIIKETRGIVESL